MRRGLVLIAALGALSGCSLVGDPPCAVDDDCAETRVCAAGFCVEGLRTPDAGDPDEDAGDPDEDAGLPPGDAGAPEDAGAPPEDAGPEDAGAPPEDAGPEDAGPVDAGPVDTDGDGVPDDEDNCPVIKNADQADLDQDAIGDACQVFAPPACEHRLTPGFLDDPNNADSGGDNSGTDDFDEMEAWMATVFDPNFDGVTVICLADGVTLQTTSAATGPALRFPRNGIFLVGEPGATAAIRNLRTDVNNIDTNSGVNIERSNISLHNLTMSVSGDEGRVVYVETTGSAGVLSKLTITAAGFHSEGIHARGPVGSVVDVTIVTRDNRGYGIEPQSNGDFQSIRRVRISTEGADAHGIGSFVTNGGQIGTIRGVEITTAGNNSHGLFLDVESSVNEMRFTTIRRSAAAVTNATAIRIGASGANFVNTPNIRDNVVCSIAPGVGWEHLLASDSGAYTAPTVPFDGLGGSVFGVQTFPWGDADDVNNDGTDDWNLQAQWGGACP